MNSKYLSFLFILLGQPTLYNMQPSHDDLFLLTDSESEECSDPMYLGDYFTSEPYTKHDHKKKISSKKSFFWQQVIHNAASIFSSGKFIVTQKRNSIPIIRPATPDYVHKTIVFYQNK